MSYFNSIRLKPDTFSFDAGSRLRTSQMTTLFDGKILNADRALLWENAGTGTGSYSNNKYNMSVTSGQWLVRQSRRFLPYFSGKSQLVECTFDNFQAEANVTKRVGYFSSNATTPFASTYDGFWLENDGSTIYLKIARAGTSTASIAITSWDNYSLISGYNWANFTVVAFDFLWLGGAVLRLWLKTDKGFVLCHTAHYSGSATDTFTLSPNQPVRYEIRSSTGSGSFRFICCQVATEGAFDEEGLGRAYGTGASKITLNAIGTQYPLIGLRKQSAFRDIAVRLDDLNVFLGSNTDQLYWSLELNPTLSASLTYSNIANSGCAGALGNGTITVTTPGTVVASGFIIQGSVMPVDVLERNQNGWLGGTLANVMDEMIVTATPITNTCDTYASLHFKEY